MADNECLVADIGVRCQRSLALQLRFWLPMEEAESSVQAALHDASQVGAPTAADAGRVIGAYERWQSQLGQTRKGDTHARQK